MDPLKRKATFRIVVRKVQRPFTQDFNEEFNFICRSLGFFEDIDKDKTAALVLKEVISGAEHGKYYTSTGLSEKVGMSRGATINHLNNLMRAGLLERDGRIYVPRSGSILRIMEELEADIERVFNSLKETAKRIDKQMGIELDE